MDRQHIEWENIFAIYLTKGYYQESAKLKQIYKKKTNSLIKTWVEDMNRDFSKEDIYAANKPMNKTSSSRIIREMQIKTTMRYHLMSVEWQSLKSHEAKDAVEDVEK